MPKILYEHPHTFINAIDRHPHDPSKFAAVGHRLIGLFSLDRDPTFLEDRARFALSCAYHPDGTKLAIAHHGGLVEILDTQRRTRIQEIRITRGPPFGARRVAWAPDGDRLIIAGNDGHLAIWSLLRRAMVWRHLNTRGAYIDMHLCHGIILGTVCGHTGKDNHAVTLHELETGIMRTFSVPTSPWAISGSSDGTRMVVGDSSGALSIYNIETLRLLSTRKGPGGIHHIRPYKAGWYVISAQHVLIVDDEDSAPRVIFSRPEDSLYAGILCEETGRGYVAGKRSEIVEFAL